MRAYLILTTALLVLTLGINPARVQAQDGAPYIYRLICQKSAEEVRTLTGFRVQGTRGVVTALHGVADCQTITAESSAIAGAALENLAVAAVDIDHDAALLHSEELQTDTGLALWAGSPPLSPGDAIYVRGHPYGIYAQLKSDLKFREPITQELRTLLVDEAVDKLAERTSPNLSISVLSIQGHLLPGHSGAPIFNQVGEVIGVGSGGLQGGTSEIVWAIAWRDIQWQPIDQVREQMDRLKGDNPAEVFEFPQHFSSTAPDGWLKLEVIVKEKSSDQQAKITQMVSTDQSAVYLLAIPDGIDPNLSAFSIKAPNGALFARGAINALQDENENDAYGFQIDNESGFPTLAVDVTTCTFTANVFHSKSQEPLERAEITLRYDSRNPYVEKTDNKGFYQFRFPCGDADQADVRIDLEGYTRHDQAYTINQARNFYLVPEPTAMQMATTQPTDTPTMTSTATTLPVATLTATSTPLDTATATPMLTATPTQTPIIGPTATPTANLTAPAPIPAQRPPTPTPTQAILITVPTPSSLPVSTTTYPQLQLEDVSQSGKMVTLSWTPIVSLTPGDHYVVVVKHRLPNPSWIVTDTIAVEYNWLEGYLNNGGFDWYVAVCRGATLGGYDHDPCNTLLAQSERRTYQWNSGGSSGSGDSGVCTPEKPGC
jgi:hypothetical protein